MNSRKHTVLIVDDQNFYCNLLKDIIDDEYNVVYATSGKQTMDIVLSQVIDLILLDIIMPDISGYEICRWIKSNPATQDIPIIFVSIKDKPQEQATGLAMGAIDYITKDTDVTVIKVRIQNQIQLKKQRDILFQLAHIDNLTELYNRHFFNETLEKLWLNALRNKEYLSALIIDIDFFKKFNDYYGHLEGDQCLKKVAQALKNSLMRPIDIVARYGGEEFVALLPSTTHDGAVIVAKRIQENIKSLEIKHELSEVSKLVTVSIGIATIRPESQHEPVDLIKRADFGLYKAKNEGRNRFIAIE